MDTTFLSMGVDGSESVRLMEVSVMMYKCTYFYFARQKYLSLCTMSIKLPVTAMVNAHVALLPLSSIASQTTSVEPIPNWLPDSRLHVNVGLDPELSLHSGSSQAATAVDWFNKVVRVWLTGQTWNKGASGSIENSYFTDFR